MSEYQYYEFQAIDRSLTDRQMRELRAMSSRAEISANGANVIVAISVERDDFDAGDDGQGWLSSLVALRAEIASGDERALSLAWLLGVQQDEIRDSSTEPAGPNGFGTLSPALESFIDIRGLDRHLVAAAMEGGRRASSASSVSPEKEIDRWIAALDDHEKVSLLGRVARGEAGVGAELMRRFRRQTTRREPSRTLRTAGALRVRTAELADQRRARILAREARERARCEREQAAARDRHLNQLATRQADAWLRVETLIASKRPTDYDAAVALLEDLREIGERKGRGLEVARHLRALRDAHAKKPSLLARLRKAGL
ncbi:MAG: hypothetical protein A3F70_14660 [Acidobacteria bacterium RIFCSPLOWO2_12_FULL_67_14]|nr:MAG: hypothetical protein A3H29_10800 [Acidobacteria bacterium RIFCSPLOWO2_02_FULL_67_21]OFW36519.1 MAG: hypothetical protein A3F70_14660 [Acidobacteria bacterium RIFCSPLOWO2_12_FULL_67_14]